MLIFAVMKHLAAALLFTLAALIPAQAESPVPETLVTATVLPGWRTGEGSHIAAIRLDLAPGWKTYWRAPGEAGIPPSFDWRGSSNLDGLRIHWPRPVVFHTNGLQTIGYHDTLILPVEITRFDPGQPIHLDLRMDMGVCSDICVPASVHVTAELPMGGKPDPAIEAALADQPGSAAKAGLTALTCVVSPIDDGMRVTATLTIPPLGPQETVVLENRQAGVWTGGTATMRDGGHLTATADMVGDTGTPFVLERGRIRLTVLAGDRAVEADGCPAG
jgi:DsbC/DsbD-like thiol-disulfide interchange protein